MLALTPDDLPLERFETLDLKGFTEAGFATLSAQIRGLEFEGALDDLEFEGALDDV